MGAVSCEDMGLPGKMVTINRCKKKGSLSNSLSRPKRRVLHLSVSSIAVVYKAKWEAPKNHQLFNCSTNQPDIQHEIGKFLSKIAIEILWFLSIIWVKLILKFISGMFLCRQNRKPDFCCCNFHTHIQKPVIAFWLPGEKKRFFFSQVVQVVLNLGF